MTILQKSLCISIVVLVVTVATVFWQKSSPVQTSGPPVVSPTSTTTASYSAPARPPLEPGDKFEIPDVEGWFNDPADETNSTKLLLVDVWGDWCPFCRKTAPELVRCFEEYSKKGVKIVSLTGDQGNRVAGFVNEFSIPWASGYGVSPEQIRDLGVFNAGMAITPGYEVMPTFYLVSATGTVLWCDGHLRMQHTPPEETMAAVKAAIDSHLAETAIQ